MTLSVGSPVTQGNLTVFPVYSRQKRPMSSEYLTLDEALKKNVILVKELPNAEVSRVSVSNKAGQPIFLISGDIILGGQQDRVVARDTIVPKGAKDFVVEVFCVEQGRWAGGQHFSAPDVASNSLRRETQRSKQQTKVWEQVAAERKASLPPGLVTLSDTSYRDVAQNRAAEKDISARVQSLTHQLSKDKRAVGVVVAVNGKVTAADVFADRKLFEKQMPKVLKSYALDAMQQKEAWAKMPRKPQPKQQQAITLLREGERGQRQTTAKSLSTVNMERRSGSVLLFEARPAAPGAASAHQNFQMNH
jgi:uncharacterized lipoprotein YbaY